MTGGAAPLGKLRAEWLRNRRLRIGGLAIVAILGLQAIVHLSEARAARIEQYERDARLLDRLEEASREAAWPQRARDAAAELEKLRATLPVASSEGLAQAELQAWLGDLAVFAGIGNPTVRVEPALAVDGQPALWQVLARLEGDMADVQAPLLMRTLAAALPWYRTERLQVQGGGTPRVSLVIRGYFRKGEGAQSSTQRPAGLPSAALAGNSGAVAPPVLRNPLARAETPLAGPGQEERRPDSPGRTPPAPPSSQPTPADGQLSPQGPATPRRRNPLAPPESDGNPAPRNASPPPPRPWDGMQRGDRGNPRHSRSGH